MSSLALSGIVFACGSAETLLGMLLRSRLPDHHLGSLLQGSKIVR